MIINQGQTDYSSGAMPQLIPLFPQSDMNPMAFGNADIGVGASAPTLPGSTPAPSNPVSGMPLQDAANKANTLFGMPPVAFYVIVFGAIAYLILWKVHFHALVAD